MMSEEFSSPESKARAARIARLSNTSSSVASDESFSNEPKEEIKNKSTRKHRGGDPPPRSPKSPRTPKPTSSSANVAHRRGKSNERGSIALDESRPMPKMGSHVETFRPSQHQPETPKAPYSPRPSSRSPAVTKELQIDEVTTNVDNDSVEVVASPKRKSGRPSAARLASRVQRDPPSSTSRPYRKPNRDQSSATIPAGSDDGGTIVKIESFSVGSRGVASYTSASGTTSDEEHGSSRDSRMLSRGDSVRSYPSVWTRLPNTSFGIAMGLAGQAIMWKIASRVDFLSTVIDTQLLNTGFWVASLTVAVMLFTAYLFKVCFHFALVKDEYKDGSRIHFLNMPHLIMIMLTISAPAGDQDQMNVMRETHLGEQIIWSIGFAIQVFFTQHIYESWLFSDVHNISCARPQFLLSTVGWFFLALLGAQAEIEEMWGLALPTWCFGFGMMLYLMVAISIFNGIHAAPKVKGSPALFLLIAPPSVGVVSWDLINNGGPGNFADMSSLLLGFCLGIFMLLIKLGPRIFQAPPSLGSYWAYVFPMSALASALIRYAWAVQTAAAEIMAVVFVVLSMFALLVVFIRMTIHIFRVWAGYAEWGDPLLSPDRHAPTSAITYSELIPSIETA